MGSDESKRSGGCDLGLPRGDGGAIFEKRQEVFDNKWHLALVRPGNIT